MKPSSRLFSALLCAAILALPGFGSEGGEGAGGTGVWILPGARFVGPGAGSSTSLTAAPMAVPSLASPMTLTTAPEVGEVTATLLDDVSGSPLPLPVSGRNVTIEKSVFQGLLASGTTSAILVITNSSQLGYVVKISIDPLTASATMTLR